MSREKAAAIIASSEVESVLYRVKRNLRPHWRRLTHEQWVEFCAGLGEWLQSDAPDEWDERVLANDARKAKSDAEALERVQEERGG